MWDVGLQGCSGKPGVEQDVVIKKDKIYVNL